MEVVARFPGRLSSIRRLCAFAGMTSYGRKRALGYAPGQCSLLLSYFHRIEERRSGFRRMRDQMLDHGLDQPLLGTEMGYFQVTFAGPTDNIERLRVPEKRLLVTPAVESKLNERQKRILAHVLAAGSVTSGRCLKEFGVVYNKAYRDLDGLVRLGLLKQRLFPAFLLSPSDLH
jgi:predicted HTH transcriptional regulator